ncbi:MAG: hypothetical protein AB1782_16395 [Cyanobacteriota bacterium]
MNNISLATKILHPLESSASIAMFTRDTGGCLVPKLSISRSADEAREIAFAEVAESAVFYFSITPIAKFFSKVFSSLFNLTSDKFITPIDTIKNNGNLIKNLKLAKFGKIAATFSVLLPLIYAIAPIRNLITLGKTGKKDFVSLINLEKTRNLNNNDDKTTPAEKARQKAISLLKKLALFASIGLTFTAGTVALARNNTIYKNIEPAINSIVKHFDFKGNAGLTIKQLGFLIMPVSIASYFIASRDKYEILENARRFIITVPMMFFGQDLVERKIYRFFDRAWGSTLTSSKGIRTYDELLKLPFKEQAINLKSKNWAIALAFLINTMAIGAAVSILNRISTKHRYQKKQEGLLLQKTHINSIRQWQQSFK